MIEINLLPHELRQAEGTPLPRLLTIFGGVILAAVGAVIAADYYVVEVPKVQAGIKEQQGEKKRLGDIQTEIDVVEKKKSELLEKINLAKTLDNSRIRWARVMHSIRQAVPTQGCVLRRLAYAPAPPPIGAPAVGSAKRYTITLQGYATGNTQRECDLKLAEFKKGLMEQFKVELKKTEPAPPATAAAPPGPAAAGPPPAAGGGPETLVASPPPGAAAALPPGYNAWLGLKFEEPFIESQTLLDKGPPKPREEKLAKQELPAKALDFVMNVTFSMRPPPTPGQ